MSNKSNLNKYNRKKTKKHIKTSTNKNVEKNNANKISEKKDFSPKTGSPENHRFSIDKFSKYLPIVLAIIVFLLYFNSINNGFLNWDDDRYVTGNSHLNFTWENIKFYFSNFYFVMYIPLSMISYMFDVLIGGGKTLPNIFHFHNIIIHIINTLLIFFVIKKLFNKNKDNLIYAFVSALLFGISPLHVESVSWIAERKDVLFAMYSFASILAYLHYISNKKTSFLIFSFILFLFSLLAKTQAVVLPFTFILIDYLNRDFLSNKEKLKKFISFKDKNQLKIFTEKLPFFALSLIFSYIAVRASGTSEPFAESISTNTKTAINTGYGLFESLVLMSYSLFLYVAETLIPFKQAAIHPYPFEAGTMPTQFIGFILFPIIYAGSVIWAWIKQEKIVVFSLLFFILNIFIVLKIKNFIISEHYLYIPSIGISILLIFFTLSIINKNKALKQIILIISILYFVFLSVITFQRNKVFENSLTFWNDVTSKYPNVVAAYYNRGNYLQKQADIIISDNRPEALKLYNQAIADYNKTIELNPSNIGAFSNRGITSAKIGDLQQAISDFDKVIQIDSTYGNVYSNRGNAYGMLGKWDKAIEDYNMALSFNPNFQDALYNRGVAYSNTNNNEAAINDLSKVIQLSPNKVDAYMYRGLSYYFSNKIDSAIIDFNIFLNVYPEKYNVIYYRGLAYEKNSQQNLAQADFEILRTKYPQIISDIAATGTNLENQADYYRNIDLYKQALDMFKNIFKIDPNSSLAYSRIGVIMGKMGDINSAFKNLNKAIELDPNNAQAYADRGYAFSIKNNTQKAMQDYNKALTLNPNDFVTYYNRSILFTNSGALSNALNDLNKSIDLNGEYSLSYLQRGTVNYRLNKLNEACADWQKALSLGIQEAQTYLDKYCKQNTN